LLVETRTRLHELLIRYGKDASRYSVIHADLHPGNVLVNGDTLAYRAADCVQPRFVRAGTAGSVLFHTQPQR